MIEREWLSIGRARMALSWLRERSPEMAGELAVNWQAGNDNKLRERMW